MSDSAERWSFSSLCILAFVISTGVLFRVCYPSTVSLSSDEIASLYFSLNPAQIFLTETHPPLFYLLLSPFSHFLDPYVLRSMVSLLSVSLLTCAALLSRKIFNKQAVTVLVILIFLSPADIFHSRTIRQYSMFLELTLIYLILIRTQRPAWIRMLVAFCISGIHPLGWIPPLTHALWTTCRENKLSWKVLYELLILVPVICWYGAKLIFVGEKAFFSHYNPAGIKYAPFYLDLLKTFSGEHFPRINYFPIPHISLVLTGIFLGVVFIWGSYLFWKKRPPVYMTLGIGMICLSLFFSEFFSYAVVDIWNGRFFIFLLAPMYLIAAQIFGQFRILPLILAIVFSVNLFFIAPLRPYVSDRELFDYYKMAKTSSPGLKLAFCGNIFHRWFYVNDKERNCHADLKAFHETGEEFVLVDLNGRGVHEVMGFKKKLELIEFRRFSYTAILRAKFTNPQTKSE